MKYHRKGKVSETYEYLKIVLVELRYLDVTGV